MKSILGFAIVFALTAPFAAQAADEYDFCKAVFEGCSAQGYTKDEIAPAGKKIWADCANVIMDQKKSVPKVNVDPNSFDAKNCHDYRQAKEKFDAAWAKSHPRK